MKQLNPPFSRTNRAFAVRIVFLVALLAGTVLLITRGNLSSSAPLSVRAVHNSSTVNVTPPTGPLTLLVNTLSDAADTSVGDGVCDSDAGTAGDQCTIRAAFEETNNATNGTDEINFSLPPNSTITLNNPLPEITGSLNINGPGAATLTIERNPIAGTPLLRIFSIGSTGTANISGLTISRGKVGNGGGGIRNQGVLNLSNSAISDSSGSAGGGIHNENGGTLTISNCTIRANFSSSFGGFGGGVANFDGTVTINDSTINNNDADSGGGIYNNGILNVNRSTINGNSNIGIFNESASASLTVTNSTISGNQAGGCLDLAGTFTLQNSTITNNSGLGAGMVAGFGGAFNVENTIIAGNNGTGQDISGAFTSQGYNLIGKSDAGNGFTNGANGDQVGTSANPIDPMLGPLANHGGPTQTQALLVGSPAIDAGTSLLTVDQRGQPRPIDDQTVVNAAGGNASDIGAYEAHIFQVNTIVDTFDSHCSDLGTDNGCTLADAIFEADQNFGQVTFAPALTSGGPATITLFSFLPDITSSIIIQGPGADLLTIARSSAEGTPDFRIFTVNEPGTTVSISGLTIANGKAYGGAGISNSSTLTVTACKFFGCEVTGNSTGVIWNGGPLLTLNDCHVGGVAAGQSNTGFGAVSNGFGTLVVNGGSVVGNHGPGILNIGTLKMDGVAVTDNINSASSIGGLYNGGTADIINCLIANNTTSSFGGGIVNQGTSLTVVNTTVSGNVADSGGGLNNNAGTVTLTNVTIADNRGISEGAGLRLTGGDTILRNSIVARNFQGANSEITDRDISGQVVVDSSFNNLIGSIGSGAGGLANLNGNRVNVTDLRLGPLADNGGPTKTRALLSGSLALDAGDNAVANSVGLTADQRGNGFSRFRDAADSNTIATVDIGAFEAQASVEDITDKSIAENTSLSFGFNVGDAAAITNVTASLSNPTLVPNAPANISVTGSGSTRTLNLTPAGNQFGTSTITVTVTCGAQSMTDSFVLTVLSVAHTPSVTAAATNEDTQTSSGLVISRNAAGPEVTHFRITAITNGELFKNNGSTQINNGDFITFAEGNAGLKFTPQSNLFSPTTPFSFDVQGATDASGSGLSTVTTATITVNPVADTPSITPATTTINTQTTSGLVISRNAMDSTEVTHFKITNITNGTLFKNNGTTQISDNAFITVAEGNLGLRFTPANNLSSPSSTFSFQVQGATSSGGAGLGSAATATITVTSPINYPNKNVVLGGNTTVTPDAPLNVTGINVSTSPDFKGTLSADPVTGVVRVTNAHPAGSYLVTVRGFNPTLSRSGTFTLTVLTGTACSSYTAFTNAADVGGGDQPESVAVGDFNNDGKQDLALANFVSNNVSIRLGNGSGGFAAAPASEVLVGSAPKSIAVGDFNNDGKLDFATANFSSHDVSIRLGNGSGGFSTPPSPEVALGDYCLAIAVGDFNDDGKLDFVTTGSAVSIRLGNGIGGFSAPPAPVIGVGNQPASVTIGDLNNDGKLDFAVTNVVSNDVSIRLGDGAGGFISPSTPEIGVGAEPISLAIGDFNGDGKRDFATANGADNNVSIRLGDGAGAFSSPLTPEVGVGSLPRSIAIGDFDNDGKQDFVAVNSSSGNISIRLGNGSGSFSAPTPAEIGVGSEPYSVAIGDFNEDGKQDFAVSHFNLPTSIRLGLCGIAPTINSANSTTFSAGTLGSFTVTATGNPPPTLSVGGTLPAGVSFTPATGQLSGTPGPNSGGTYNLTFNATNGFAPSASQNFTLTVLSPAHVSGQKTVSGTFAPNGTVTYSVVLTNTGPAAQRDNPGNEFIDVLPPALTLVSANATSGTAVSTVGTNTVTWNGNIAANGAVTINISAIVKSNAGGATVTNQGTIAYDADGNGTNEASALTDDPSVAGGPNPTNFHVNAPPTIAAVGVTRTAGSPSSNSTIANVNDTEDAKSTLSIEVNGNSSATISGVSVSNLSVTAAGVVTANVVAACGATTANFTLKVTDTGGLANTSTLSVTVNANSAPTVSYPSSQTVALGASLIISPASGPSDNGSISSISVQSKGTYTGTVSVNNSTGVVSISNATPGGTHTITIRATDNCGATTDESFKLIVSPAATTTAVTSSVNPSELGQSVTFTATVTSGAGTPAGTVQFKDGGTSIGSPQTLNESGVAQVSTSTLTSGTHTITAEYSGDASFLNSTGTLSGGQVVKTQPSLSINDVTMAEGNSGTTNFVFTVTLSATSSLTVTANYATADGTATLAGNDYQSAASTLTFNPGDLTKTVTLNVNGDPVNEPNETVFLNLSSPVNAAIADAQGLGTILNDDAPTIQFSSANYLVDESTPGVTITLTRSGDTSGSASVDYNTIDDPAVVRCDDQVNNHGAAYARCDYATSIDTANFAAGEMTKTFTIPIINDGHAETPEMFQVTLSNPVGAGPGIPSIATVTANDNDTANTPNPILAGDDAGIAFFVRMNYLDFLGREPEPGEPWSNLLRNCSNQFNVDPASPAAGCDRLTVSGAIFGSPEFLIKGVYTIQFYRVAFNRLPEYVEFAPDLRSVSGATAAETNAKRAAFANNFVLRTEFVNMFAGMSNADYVNTLMGRYSLTSITTPDPASPDGPNKVTLTSADLINRLNAATLTRAQVLREIVQSDEVNTAETVRSFVASQYFGYLRRTPEEPGFTNWVSYLNTHPGDYRTMVNGFMNSFEYRLRFGTP